MQPNNLDQLQLRLYQLQQEITLLERKRDSVFKEIQNAEQSRKLTFSETSRDITKLKEEKTSLLEQVKDLKTDLGRNTSSLQESKESLLAFNQGEITKINEQIKVKRQELTQKEEENRTRSAQLALKEGELEEQIDRYSRLEQEVAQKGANLDAKQVQIAIERSEMDDWLEKGKTELANKAKEVQLLGERIVQARIELSNINSSIKRWTEEASQMKQQAKEVLETVLAREKVLDLKEESLANKEKELNEKEIWLTDREQTAARAYDEIIAKGGKI